MGAWLFVAEDEVVEQFGWVCLFIVVIGWGIFLFGGWYIFALGLLFGVAAQASVVVGDTLVNGCSDVDLHLSAVALCFFHSSIPYHTA